MAEIPPIAGEEEMEDDFDVDAYHLENARWLEQAVAESDAACAWANNYCLKPKVLHLGEKAGNIYSYYYSALFKFHDEICRLAIKSWWIAQRQWKLEWATFMATNEVIEGMENEYLPEKLEDFQNNYIDGDKGEAFYNFLGRNSFITTEHFSDALKLYCLCLRKPRVLGRVRLSNSQVPDTNDTVSSQNRQALLKGIALHWFSEADDLMAAGNTLAAFDAMSDAFSALLYLSFEEACQGSYDSASYDKSMSASNWAKLRHAKTYEKRQQVINYWHEHIYPGNPNLSNEKAGEWLKDSFPDISVRKLSEYVSRAKKEAKKIPPAGTA